MQEERRQEEEEKKKKKKRKGLGGLSPEKKKLLKVRVPFDLLSLYLLFSPVVSLSRLRGD